MDKHKESKTNKSTENKRAKPSSSKKKRNDTDGSKKSDGERAMTGPLNSGRESWRPFYSRRVALVVAAAEMTGPLSSLSLSRNPTHFLPPPVSSQRPTRRTVIHFRLRVCIWVHGRDPVHDDSIAAGPSQRQKKQQEAAIAGHVVFPTTRHFLVSINFVSHDESRSIARRTDEAFLLFRPNSFPRHPKAL